MKEEELFHLKKLLSVANEVNKQKEVRSWSLVRVVLTMIILFKVEMKAKVEEMKEVVALLAKTEEEVFT